MKRILTILASVAVVASLSVANAQKKNDFDPYWFLQLQGGAAETIGETTWTDLISPSGAISLGYQFSPVFAARLNANAWQGKGAINDGKSQVYKYNYVEGAVDLMADLAALFGGYKFDRTINPYIFGGVGANYAFNNDEACDAAKAMLADNAATVAADDQFVRNLWDGTKTRLMGQFGATVDFRISKAVSLGLEVSANTVNDHYNSKQAPNPDFYYNLLAGVKINLGKTHQSKTIEVPTKTIERVIERPVAQPTVERPQRPVQTQQPEKEPLRREVFFPVIRSVNIPADQMGKVEDVANYLKKYPQAKVTVTGYADKNTGNPTINQGYSEKRAQAVVDALTGTYGIDASRIVKVAKGDTEQPFSNNDSNRVSICIAE